MEGDRGLKRGHMASEGDRLLYRRQRAIERTVGLYRDRGPKRGQRP